MTTARLYIMQDAEGLLKLGYSTDPERRRRQVEGIWRPVELVHQTENIENVERVELLAHRVLALHGRHVQAEWFAASVEDAKQAIAIAQRQASGAELPLGKSCGKRRKLVADDSVTIRLPSDAWRDLREIAERDRRSLPGLIRHILGRVVDTRRGAKQP